MKRVHSALLIPLITFLLAGKAVAEEVRVFTRPPSADEMGRLLFPDKAAPNRPKTRSLTFTAVAEPEQKPAQESIAIALPIQFDFDSARLREEAKAYLDEIGRMLTMERFARERLLIEGHTDASGPAPYNQQLSLQRAKAVKDYLVSHYAIQPDRLKIVGRGESRPLPNHKPTDPLNRRVELHRID